MHGLGLRRWAVALVSGGLCAALGACLIGAPGRAGASPGLAKGSPTRYYVALGDSLATGGGAVAFLGMTYHAPYLAFWLEGGAAGHAAARQSLRLVRQLNHALQRIYRRYGVRLVDGQAAFHTSDFKSDGSFEGQTLPLNVDRICQWTHMCSFGADIAEALM